MGLYETHVLPYGLAWVMARGTFRRERPRATRGLAGSVLELGFGTGLNLPHYPDAVHEVLAVEPSRRLRAFARERIEAARAEVTFVGLRGEELPLEDASVDAVLSTWTLCSIPGLASALSEVRRVLRPGGALHYLEHGASDDPGVFRWQRRLTPLQRRLAGGCHLDRDIPALLREAGFRLEDEHTFRMPGPRPLTHHFVGRAVRP